jgi:hypothetical protein
MYRMAHSFVKLFRYILRCVDAANKNCYKDSFVQTLITRRDAPRLTRSAMESSFKSRKQTGFIEGSLRTQSDARRSGLQS